MAGNDHMAGNDRMDGTEQTNGSNVNINSNYGILGVDLPAFPMSNFTGASSQKNTNNEEQPMQETMQETTVQETVESNVINGVSSKQTDIEESMET